MFTFDNFLTKTLLALHILLLWVPIFLITLYIAGDYYGRSDSVIPISATFIAIPFTGILFLMKHSSIFLRNAYATIISLCIALMYNWITGDTSKYILIFLFSVIAIGQTLIGALLYKKTPITEQEEATA